MRTAFSLAVLLASGLAGTAQAQCYYIAPPRAPDMQNQPGYYLYNCQGYLYGPYYCVRPPFQPFQGMLPGPQQMPGRDFSQPAMYGGAMANSNANANGGPGGVPGLWMHPAVRSPRDFYMVDTDPARADYRFGVGRGLDAGNGGGPR